MANKSVATMVLRRLCRPLPLTAFVTTVGVVEYRRINHGESEAKPWEITCYSSVPLRVMSRGWGWICNKEIPVSLRTTIYSKYAYMFNVNLDEAVSQDLASYRSLCEFFCRELREGARSVAEEEPLVSPADGTVLNTGKVVSSKVEQVKGVTYSLETFLGKNTWNNVTSTASDAIPSTVSCDENSYINSLLKNKDNVLYQCVVYLAPGDYHRFHSPVDWTVHFRRHIQGKLFSVNPKFARWIPDLFSLNERAVYIGEWKHGFFSFAAVGATNVGSIHVYKDKSLKTNESKWKARHKDQEKFLTDSEGRPLYFKKGDPFGEFRLGSTVVLIFEAPKDFKFSSVLGKKIHFGEAVSCGSQFHSNEGS